MAENKRDNSPKPAQPSNGVEAILESEKIISAKADEMLDMAAAAGADIRSVLNGIASGKQELERICVQSEAIHTALGDECESLRRELNYLAVQSASIFDNISEKFNELKELIEEGEKSYGKAASEASQPSVAEIDYDRLADKLAKRMAENSVQARPYQGTAYAPAQAPVDYDLLAEKLAARMPAQQVYPAAVQPVIDYDLLADKLALRMPQTQTAMSAQPYGAPAIDYDTIAQKIAVLITIDKLPEINSDEIADKVVSRMPAQEVYSPDYIASRIAEQIIIPPMQAEMDFDYEYLSGRVADKIAVPDMTVALDNDYIVGKISEKITTANVDYEYLAQRVASSIGLGVIDSEFVASRLAEKLVIPEQYVVNFDYDLLAEKVAEKISVPEVSQTSYAESNVPFEYDVNEAELADAIALRVGSLKAEDFEILVDDEGCASLAKEICGKFDYEKIADTVAEKLHDIIAEVSEEEPDYDDMAAKISEKINVAAINEETIAEKAAAVLSNYLPEFDTDDIADKVAEQVISALPAIDHDALTQSISDRIIASQEDNDYEVVLDDEGLDRVSDSVSEKICKTTDEAFEVLDGKIGVLNNDVGTLDEEVNAIDEQITKLNKEIEEIKELLLSGALIVRSEQPQETVTETVNDTYSAYEDYNTYDDLVTVSDLIEVTQDYDEEEPEEIVEEKVVEEPEEIVEEEVVEEPEEIVEEEVVEEPEEIVEEEVVEEPEEIVEEEVVEEPEEIVEEEVTEEPEEIVEEEITEEPEEIVEEEVIEEPEEIVEEEITEEPEEIVEEEITEEPEEIVEEEITEEHEVITEQTAKDEIAAAYGSAALIIDDDDEDDETEEESESDEETEELPGGVDFANMMRFNRSFIARIIQSTDDQKKYYGEVRNALLSYRKVNSNIAWGAERFHKGRETIARFKIRGKTLVLYLALDPQTHEISVYHHKDVSDNKSVAGTPMMIKIKSPRGVKKAIRLIDEMLAAREGIKRNVPERDYAAMYPYESMEELIEDGLVKDVRKNK